MFTSSGYFRGLNCPYFINGLCERTYCHFRHSKAAQEKESTLFQRSVSHDNDESSVPAKYGGPSNSYKPTPKESRGAAPSTRNDDQEDVEKQSVEKEDEDETKDDSDGSKIGPYGKYWPSQQYEPIGEEAGGTSAVKYTPTPITALENKPKPQKILQTHAKGGAMLEYNPTPIVQLQQMRRKPSHRLKGKSAEGMEYDPESNFSTFDLSKSSDNDNPSRKRAMDTDGDQSEYVPTKRNHTDIMGEFSDDDTVEKYEPGVPENLPEYIPSTKTSNKYPVDYADVDREVSSSSKCQTEADSDPKVQDSRLSMDDYLKLLLNPTKPTMSLESKKFELKKKGKDSKSNNARANSVKSDKHSTSKTSTRDTDRKTKDSKLIKSSSKDGHRSNHKESDRRKSKEGESSHSQSDKVNGGSPRSKSRSNHNEKDKSSHNHKSSSSSSSSKHHSASSSSHKSESNSKSRHSSSDKNSSRSHKQEKSTSNVHFDSESDTKSALRISRLERSESNGLKGKNKILDVNVDLFGMDSDGSDDNGVKMSKRDSWEDRDSDDTFRGDNLDSDVEIPLDISDLDEEVDTYEECLRIFKENKHSVKLPDIGKRPKKVAEEEEETVAVGKKRKAHVTEPKAVTKALNRARTKLSPGEVMHNRFVQMQQRALETAKANQPSTSGLSSKSRLAHGASLASRQKEKITIATASKSEKRKAHEPAVVSLPRPTVPADFGSKIPTNVRQRYLNLIIDECLKLCKTEKEAYDRALDEEKSCYSRATSKNIYLNVSVNMIKKLRVELVNKNSEKTPKANPATTLSHQAMLGGLKATQISYTLNRSQGAPKAQTANYMGVELFKRLVPYILPEEQLVENGFPRWDADNPGAPTIKERDFGKSSPTKAMAKANRKLCVRCGKRFEVYPNGKYAMQEECVYHWGKAWKKRIAGSLDTRYTCCSSDIEVKGCQICENHVYDSNKYENLSGFMRTLPCSPPIDGDYGTYAMDCEMVYTFGGCELARVTVIAPDMSAIYESLVKPDKPVIDYNTRFSGITAEDMKGVTASLRDVQAILLSLFTDRTILLGHSLESDLIALKLIHSTVVDTSVVYPHRMGPPFKRALKTLMAEYLQKIIQDDVGGHDSHEDAASCLELMQLKLKEDARRQIRRN